MVLALIRKHHLENRVILQSFDFRTLRAMKKLAPEIRRSALTENDKRDFVTIAREAEATIISPEYGLVTKDKVEQAHAAGLQVVPWTPNKPEEWDRLIDAGVDAIISDDPAALIARLKSRGLRSLFHCHAFRQITGLVHITTPPDGDMVRKQLERDNFQERQ